MKPKRIDEAKKNMASGIVACRVVMGMGKVCSFVEGKRRMDNDGGFMPSVDHAFFP